MKSLVTLWIEVICLVSVFYIAAGRIIEVDRDVGNILGDLNPAAWVANLPADVGKCQCIKYDCGCCVRFTWEEVKLVNATGCVNVSYLPDQYGFSLVLTLNGVVLVNETVSAKNPPPICVGVPYLKKELSLCVDFYNLEFTKQYIGGCVKLQARIAFVHVKSLDLGCFRIPLHSAAAQHTAAAVIQSIEAARLKKNPF